MHTASQSHRPQLKSHLPQILSSTLRPGEPSICLIIYLGIYLFLLVSSTSRFSHHQIPHHEIQGPLKGVPLSHHFIPEVFKSLKSAKLLGKMSLVVLTALGPRTTAISP